MHPNTPVSEFHEHSSCIRAYDDTYSHVHTHTHTQTHKHTYTHTHLLLHIRCISQRTKVVPCQHLLVGPWKSDRLLSCGSVRWQNKEVASAVRNYTCSSSPKSTQVVLTWERVCFFWREKKVVLTSGRECNTKGWKRDQKGPKKNSIFFTARALVQWIHCTSARTVHVHLCTASLLHNRVSCSHRLFPLLNYLKPRGDMVREIGNVFL